MSTTGTHKDHGTAERRRRTLHNVLRIARAEWTHLGRSKVAITGLVTLLLLISIAVAVTQERIASEQMLREQLQDETDALLEHQPSRHPHRMVHYGTYAHRPVNGLAAFEPGVDSWTGTLIYLEGHRQNSATFSEARENAALMRFGELTPAFVLNSLVPLLLIFIGFSSITREREQGHLNLLRIHGVSGLQILAGKSLGLAGVALMTLLPAFAGLALISWNDVQQQGSAALMGLYHLLYLLLWVSMIAAASALLPRSRDVLVFAVGLWILTVVLIPRLAGAAADHLVPLPSRAETDLAIQQDLRRIGDSHNPDDPYFTAFRKRMLREHGVNTVEELPFNYRGRLMEEGEALTSRLFDRYAQQSAASQIRQQAYLEKAGWISPAIALRLATMSLAATDLDSHLSFLAQAEAHRYAFIQSLNRLHAEKLNAEDDARRSVDVGAEQRTRIDAHHWAELPEFRFEPSPLKARIAAGFGGAAALLLWLIVAAFFWLRAARRLDGQSA